MIRAFQHVLGLIGILLLSGQSSAVDLKILTENLPPFNMAANGKNYARGENVTGVSTDIVRAMCKKAEIECKITLKFPWKRIYSKTLNTNNYAVFSTSRTKDREALFHWVGPLVEEQWVLFSKPDSPLDVATLKDVSEFSIGGYQGDAIADYLENKGIRVIRSSDNRMNIEKLMRGHLDLWAAGSIAGPYFAKEAGVVGLVPKVAFYNDRMWLAVNKKTDPAIVDKLQKALDLIKKNGEVDRIMAKYH